MDKTIILYVTKTGNCRIIAQKIASLMNADIAEIVDLVDRSGKLGFLKAGASSFKGEQCDIQDPNVDLSLFSNVILVQPMWAFSICPPMRTWLERHKKEIGIKKIGLIVSYLGTNPAKIKNSFEQNYYKLKTFSSIAEKLSDEQKDDTIKKFIENFMSA